MTTKIIKADKASIAMAASLLKDGQVVAIPTETVYGLAANALDVNAIDKIFTAKGRPRDNPLIVHVTDFNMAKGLGLEVLALAEKLTERFWPGPLTIIMRRRCDCVVPTEISCGLDTVAVRAPSHKTALQIIERCGFPLAAPSANISGSPSPTKACHVQSDLNGKIPLIIDGGDCYSGVESTVVMLHDDFIRILRPGAVTAGQLQEYARVIIDDAVYEKIKDKPPHSPGTAHKHYSPKAEVIAVVAESPEAFAQYILANKRDGDLALDFSEQGDEGARLLFARLREADEMGARRVFALLPKPDGIGLAVYNRLIRAAEFNIININKQAAMTDFNELNIIGLTGMSGAGKSTAAEVFARQGFCVIDCDKTARRVINSEPCASAVQKVFPEAYRHNELDRVKMAALVFSDSEKLARYQKIVFPYIICAINDFILSKAKTGERNFLLDAPTLYQSGADGLCGKVLAIISDRETCIRRIVERDNIKRDSAALRLNAQPDAEFYKSRADVFISNDGGIKDFEKNIFEAIGRLA